MRGVRWLGPSARVVSFSSEKTAHGYRNTLLITDVRSRASLPFREVGPEAAPMLGIRASASGRYLLILLRGAPSEIWAVSAPLWASPSITLKGCCCHPLAQTHLCPCICIFRIQTSLCLHTVSSSLSSASLAGNLQS